MVTLNVTDFVVGCDGSADCAVDFSRSSPSRARWLSLVTAIPDTRFWYLSGLYFSIQSTTEVF